MYLTKLPEGDRFVWSIYVTDDVPEVLGVPISGWAATLDRATAAMLTSYGRMRAKAGLPKRSAKVAKTPALCGTGVSAAEKATSRKVSINATASFHAAQ